MRSVYVGIPTYRGYRGWHKFALNLLELKDRLPFGSMIDMEEFGEGVCAARNSFTRKFLQGNWTHILYMDDDELPNPDAVNQLMRLRKPVVTGLVPRCSFPHHPPIGDVFERDDATGAYIIRNLVEFDWEEPFEVDWCGSGFLLVDRRVFSKLDEVIPENDPYWMKEYKPYYMSEDIRLSLMLREAGIKVTVEPRCHVSHIRGGFVYTMQIFKNLLRQGEIWRWDEDHRYYPRF